MPRFAKYPSCFGELSLAGLCRFARHHGMYVIGAHKPGMHVYNEIALYGSSVQMKALAAEWAAHGNKLKPRSFHAVFGAPIDLPVAKWLDVADHASRVVQEPRP